MAAAEVRPALADIRARNPVLAAALGRLLKVAKFHTFVDCPSAGSVTPVRGILIYL